MKVLDPMAEEGFEQVVALSDPSCGLAGFTVLQDTSRGPAIGAGSDSTLTKTGKMHSLTASSSLEP